MRKTFAFVFAAVAAAVLSLAAPAVADEQTTVTSPIQATNEAITIGEATFVRTTASNGVGTVVARGVVPGGYRESHLCWSTQPFTRRISAGQCQFHDEDGGTASEFTVTIPAADASRTVYFQYHFVIGEDPEETAFAGWRAGNPFFGNVAVLAPEPGTPVPVESIGGVAFAGVAAAALWVSTRRRRASGQFTRH